MFCLLSVRFRRFCSSRQPELQQVVSADVVLPHPVLCQMEHGLTLGSEQHLSEVSLSEEHAVEMWMTTCILLRQTEGRETGSVQINRTDPTF